MEISLLLIIPLVTGLFCLIPKKTYWIGRIQTIGMFLLLGVGLFVTNKILQNGAILAFNGFVYLDALSGIMIFLITLISMLASLYSIGYMVNEVEERIHNIWKLKVYYLLLNAFIVTMLLIVTANSLGVMWIAIEATTLVSAFLVGYYNKETSVEAAWKYIILCTVGIAFAMIGIVLGYYAITHAGGIKEQGLNWNYLITIAHKLDPNIMKVAFLFVLIGYGTKAGLAPMHTWLPDAHSEAPTPVSALLSGVLIKCGIYSILRFAILTNIAIGCGFTNKLLLFFGLLSLVIAAFFILIQNNIKRLLAYSSLEHIGVITCGIAFGNPISIFGALIHMINHAMVKTLMFFTSGNLVLKYHTKQMEKIKGVIQLMPISGVVLLLGGLALAGSPPFSIFMSEFYIVLGGVQGNHIFASVLFVLMLVIVFGGLTSHLLQMSIGPVPDSFGKMLIVPKGEINRSGLVAMAIPLTIVCLLGFYIPAPLLHLVNEAVKVVNLGHAL